MQLKQLWDFMQVDLEADKFEDNMRKSPNRQNLLKQRNELLAQQENMKKIESEVYLMQDRYEAIRDELERLEGMLKKDIEEFENKKPESIEEAENSIKVIERLKESFNRYEAELKRMRKDIETRDRQQTAIKQRAAKAKQEYEAIKAVYDEEFKRDSATLKKMRADIETEASKLDGELISTYRQIKQHTSTPMARLTGNQCGGCFMELPAATLLEARKGDTIVTCDQCGRILYSN